MSTEIQAPTTTDGEPQGPRPITSSGGRDARSRGADFFQRSAGLIVLVVFLIVFSAILPGKFLSYDNLIGIVANGALTGIIALGLLLPLSAGIFDLSIAGMLTLTVVASSFLFQITSGALPVWLAILVALAVAAVVGLFNAFLVLKVKIDPFIATIGVSSLLIGLSQIIGNGASITSGIPKEFTDFGRAQFFRIPISALVFVLLALVLWYVLQYTPFGRQLYATGAAREAARLTGIHTSRIITIALVGSAIGAAIAGILLAARLGQGPPGLGDPFLLGAYSTAFLSTAIIHIGRFNVLGLVIATLIIGVGVNGLQLLGTPFWVVPIFQGGALLVAVTIGKVRFSRR